MSSNLESEDLVGVQLVRMEDVQPARDRPVEATVTTAVKDEDLETCIVDDIDYENECIVDDDDSNIGSMVSIQSEEVLQTEEVSVPSHEVSTPCEKRSIKRERTGQILHEDYDYDDSSTEMIIPEVIKPRRVVINVTQTPKKETKTAPESWPTLEILPGGVIKRSEYIEKDTLSSNSKDDGNESDGDADAGEKMYACAKCSKSFKYLYCLVKHVRWHEKQQKSQQSDLSKLCTCVNGNFVCVHTSHTTKRIPRAKANKKLPKKTKS
ncbi:hypothetical protein ABMA27_010273 [Loxostege sticticalis]|uniref:C2H2-type domain-containing protein n=1 Tax=Loxostege sticticalis TaxID=481309 RepID=A0ABR3H572_LOXSC